MHTVLEFETRYRTGKDPEDYVLLAPRGEGMERTQTWHRVKTLVPDLDPEPVKANAPSYVAQKMRWDVVGPAYEAWKSGNELPEDGTALAAWGGVTAEQVKVLRRLGIKTVEAVRDIDDKSLSTLNWPDARKLPELAKSFLESTSSAEKDRELSEMRERMAAMEEMLESATKPKRGRPPKDEAA